MQKVGVIELLFYLPLSNGHLERVFLQLKLIKNDRRINLNEDRLDQLIWTGVDGPPSNKRGSSNAINDWYNGRATASTRASSSSSIVQDLSEGENECQQGLMFSLDDWKEWVQINTGEEIGEDKDDVAGYGR